jgi:Bacterial membrane protein YfhO
VTDKIKGKTKWVKSTDYLAGLALFFASLLFFYDLFKGRYLLTERDLGPYFIPPRFFWVESIKHFDFPLWNPYQFSGHPFFANPQHALLYPFNVLFFLLPFDVAFNGIIILHFFLGGFFTYLFVRDLKVNSTGALISGLIFMLSGYLLSVHSLLTILLSSVWMPLIMMFFRRAMIGQGFKNEILTAILITISFLGGGIEIVYGNFFVLLIMALFSPFPYIEFVGDQPRHYRFIRSVPIYWGRIKSLFIVSILFLFLSAIQLFPFVELFHHSIRGSGMTYQEATTWSFAPKDVLLFFLPDAYGYFLDMKKYWMVQCWFKTLYTGGLPFILSLIFFLFWRHIGEPFCDLHNRAATEGRFYKIYLFGNDRGLYLSLMLLSLFLSLGHYNPLYPFVFKYIPFFNGIRYPAKFLYIFILVLSITAGLGFQRLTELSKECEHKRYKNLFIVFSLICGFFLLFLVLGHKEIEHFLKLRGIDFPQFNHLSVNLFHAKRFFFYLALFFLLIRVGDEVKWKGWAKILLIFFLTADLLGNMGFYWKEKTADYFQKTRISEIISSDKDPFRIFSTGKTIAMDTPILVADPSSFNVFKEKHLPSFNLIFRLHDVWGIDVIRLKRIEDLYKAFTSSPSILATNLVNLYGVKYVISITPIERDPRFELIYARTEGLQGKREYLLKENTIKLYKNLNPLPRAWLVKDFKVLDSKEILPMMTQKGFRPDREVLLEEDPKWGGEAIGSRRGPLLQRTNDGGEPLSRLPQKVEFISEKNNRLQLLVNSTEDNLLVLSDTYYPGWKAFVNGKETKIYRVDYTFRGISLNAGTHQVEFVYDPISFKLGAGATFLGILGCIVFGWVARRTKKA